MLTVNPAGIVQVTTILVLGQVAIIPKRPFCAAVDVWVKVPLGAAVRKVQGPNADRG